FFLCEPRLASSRRVPPGSRGRFAMSIDLESRPRLAPGCRMNEKTQQPRTLLMPERALRLNGPSLEIVERCDGKRTIAEIVADLQRLYSKAQPAKEEQN